MFETSVILLVLNILLFVVFFIVLKLRFSPRRVLREIEKELELLYKDLQREVDSDISLVEDRIASLRELIAVADKRVLLAASEIEKREKASSLQDNLEQTVSASSARVYTRRQIAENAFAAQKAASSASFRSVPAAGSAGLSAAENAGNAGTAEGTVAVPAAEEETAADGARVRVGFIPPEIPDKDRVLMLARKDISPEEIAKILSLPQSAVDMILDLDS